jgi:NitT/TauT family transport system ATP-binding protein
VAPSGTPILAVQNLYKEYETRDESLLALRNVNLDICAGEFISCVGPSGCGKSTLLNILGGLLEYTAGEVWFKGQVHSEPRREIGMMFQTPVLFDWRTILDNVLLPIEILGLAKAAYRSRALELLDLVGLKGFETAYPRQLSGGMQQRAALSRVLVYDPEVLLLDEHWNPSMNSRAKP